MKLKIKILIWVLILTFVLIVSSALIANNLLLDHISDHEDGIAREDLMRISLILKERIDNERVTATEWSNWDDTYEFMEKKNEGYIQSVLIDQTFINSGLHVVLFISPSGELVYGKAFDQNQKKEIPLPPEFIDNLKSHQLLNYPHADFPGNVGLLLLENQLMIVSAQPVLTSSGSGPSRGLLVRGKILELTDITEKTGLSPDILQICRPGTESCMPVTEVTSETETIYLIPESDCHSRDENKLCAILVTADFYGEPITISLANERTTYLAGIRMLSIILLTILIGGILFAVGFIYISQREVAIPLESLSKQAQDIADTGDPTRRISILSGSEFKELGTSINTMLQSLENATQEKLRNQQNYQNLFASSKDGIIHTDPSGKIVDANPSALHLLGSSSTEELSKYSLSDVCDPKESCTIPLSSQNDHTDAAAQEANLIPIREDQEPIPVDLTKYPQVNEEGRITSVWWLIRDLRERKESEKIQKQSLIQIQNDIEQMSILNDEIRNPLTVIMGLISTDDPDAKDEIIQQVKKIDAILTRLDTECLNSIKVHQFIQKYYGDSDQSPQEKE